MSCFAVPHDLTCYLQIGIHHFLLYNLLTETVGLSMDLLGRP